jgi:glycosyltransferase involved in cell wall biosynthesis
MKINRLKSKKILYVFDYFPPHNLGGAGISGKIRLEKLSKKNHIVVLTPNYDNFKLEKNKKEYLLIKYPSFRYFLYKTRKQTSHKLINKKNDSFFSFLLILNILSGIEMKFWIWKINRKYGDFDILHGNNIESDTGVAFSNIKSKKIAQLRDLVIFKGEYAKNRFQRAFNNLLKNFIKKMLVKKIDGFVTISKFMKFKCAKILKISPERFEVVYVGVSKDQICELNKSEARNKLKLDKNKKYVLFVGSLTEYKGIDFLAEEIIPKIKDVQFLIIGKGHLEKRLRQNLPLNAKMYGFIPNKEIKYFYKSADVVVVPSVFEEAWGRVSSEAQANGAFAIVNDCGGLPETIIKGKGAVVKNKQLLSYLKQYFKLK